jgi:hypothetical protein
VDWVMVCVMLYHLYLGIFLSLLCFLQRLNPCFQRVDPCLL